MKLITTALPIAVAGVLALGAPAGVAAAGPAQLIASGKCTFNFHLGGPYLKDGAIIGGGYVDCGDGRPDVFDTTLRLKFKPRGGDWATRAIESSGQIPAPVLNIATWSTCEHGGWVMTVEMWDTRGGKTTQYTDESSPMITTC